MKTIFLSILILVSFAAYSQAEKTHYGNYGWRDSAKFYKQAQYQANYGSTFNTRSLVDKGYVDSSRNKARDSVAALTLSATATLDFPTTVGQTSSDLTITVTGAAVGDPVSVGYGSGLVFDNTCITAFVSATDTVKVRFNNYSSSSSSAIDPVSATVKVKVFK